MTVPGWYRDPAGLGDGRYWDGGRWTDQITREGATLTVPLDPNQAATPPAPGTEYVPAAPMPVAAAPVAASPSGGSKSVVGTVIATIAVIIAIVALVIALTQDSDSGNEGEPTPSVAPTAEPEPTASS